MFTQETWVCIRFEVRNSGTKPIGRLWSSTKSLLAHLDTRWNCPPWRDQCFLTDVRANKVAFFSICSPASGSHYFSKLVSLQQKISAAARQCGCLCPLTGSFFKPGWTRVCRCLVSNTHTDAHNTVSTCCRTWPAAMDPPASLYEMETKQTEKYFTLSKQTNPCCS